MEQIKGGSYPNNSFLEEGSILILKNILHTHSKKFKPYISENDKTPNTDGKIEVLTESQSQYGLLDVQIKTLDKKKSKVSYSVELKLLAYIRDSSQIPFVLIVVDQYGKKAYWKHIDSEIAYSLIQKTISRDQKKGKSTTERSKIGVIFEEANELSNNQLWNHWKALLDDFKLRIHDYPKLKEEYDKIKQDNDLLIKANGDHSLPNDHSYIEINKFLETLNSLLNNQFKIVKSIYRVDFWRFGIDLLRYKDRNLAYSLKFISWADNVQQIRVLKVENEEEFGMYIPNSFFFRAISGVNPIKDNPKKYAYELSYDLFKYALKNEVFWFDIELLKKEYISMIHGTKGFAGVNPQAKFSLDELILKINEVLKKNPREKEFIENFPESKYNLIRALDYIQDLQINGITKLETRTGALNSIKSVFHNSITYGEFSEGSDEIIFDYWSSFVKAYDLVCEKYFSGFNETLKYHNNFGCEVLVPIIDKQILENGHYLHHSYLLIYDLAEIPNGYNRVIIRSDLSTESNARTLPFINFNGKDYKVVRWRTIRLSELTKNDLPIRDRILTLLDEKISSYLKELTK
jgi:hypothetical protein